MRSDHRGVDPLARRSARLNLVSPQEPASDGGHHHPETGPPDQVQGKVRAHEHPAERGGQGSGNQEGM
jgi:hypothetical protein